MLLIASPLAAQGADLSVEISGIDDRLRSNVEAMLDLQEYVNRDVSIAQIRLLYAAADEQIRAALRPYGYYHAKVAKELQRPAAGQVHARLRIDPGPPVIVRDVRVEVLGAAAAQPEVVAALSGFEPREGDQLRDALYERSKASVNAALRAAGFFDSRTIESRIAVRPEENTAEIDLVWRSGERYQLGVADFSQSQFTEEFLRGYVPWEPPAPYSSEDVLKLQERLVEADYFSVVAVQPQIDRAAQGVVPVEVMLKPDKRTQYAAGLYLSTDTGAGGRVGTQRRWLNRRGHKAEGRIEYSQRLQEAMIDYRIPRPGPFNRDYTFGAAYLEEQTDSSHARMTALAAAEARERWHGFNRTLGLQFLDSDFERSSPMSDPI